MDVIGLQAEYATYSGSVLLTKSSKQLTEPASLRGLDFSEAKRATVGDESGAWTCALETSLRKNGGRGVQPVLRSVHAQLDFTFAKTAAQLDGDSGSSVSAAIALPNWRREDIYLVIPAAIYNGNRFESRPVDYSPRIPPEFANPKCPIIVNDVPRLAPIKVQSNSQMALDLPSVDSRLQLMTRDMSTPAVAVLDRQHGHGLVINMDSQGDKNFGEFRVEVEEGANGALGAVVRISAPGIREGKRYWQTKMSVESTDRGAQFKPTDRVTIGFSITSLLAPKPTGLWQFLLDHRFQTCNSPLLYTAAPHHCVYPTSAAVDLIAEKYNRDNWHEGLGVYASAVSDPGFKFFFQSGWVGGMMITLPLMLGPRSTHETRLRVRRNVEKFLKEAPIAGSDYLFGRLDGKTNQWTTDYSFDTRPGVEHFGRLTLVRRQADCLLFVLRLLNLLPSDEVNPAWWTPLEKLSHAIVKTWRENGQLGFFVDSDTGEVAVGNSTSAALVPAALVASFRKYRVAEFETTAKAIASNLYEKFIDGLGLTCGGPGDAMMCADSESAFHLVESLVSLYELDASTGNEENAADWLEKAGNAAALFATWVVTYDFEYKPSTLFGKLDMKTKGSVWANVQNKHSSVGICTHSGSSLLRLFRAGGDWRFLALLADITRAMPQFVSRADRPLIAVNGHAQPPGWVNERVNLSDWDGAGVGGIHPESSSWCETAILLVGLEIPSIYIDLTSGRGTSLDNVLLESVTMRGTTQVQVVVHNPTAFDAVVTIMTESDADRRKILPDGYFRNFDSMFVKARQSATVTIATRTSETTPLH